MAHGPKKPMPPKLVLVLALFFAAAAVLADDTKKDSAKEDATKKDATKKDATEKPVFHDITLKMALAKAKKEKKIIMLDFYTDG
jgi:thiol:disulfide interchange protein